MKSIIEYLLDNLSTKDKYNLHSFNDYINNIDFNDYNRNQHSIIANVYYKYIDKRLSKKLKKILNDTYNLKCHLTDHFMIRLLSRFRNTPIDFLMNDISRAYHNRSQYSRKYGIIRGNYYKVIYNDKQNVFITITNFTNFRLMRNYNRKHIRRR